MKKKLSIILLTWGILTLTVVACNNNNTTSANSNIYVDINGDNNGCTVISYLDGARPVTMTTDGTFENYTSINNGAHSVSVWSVDVHSGLSCTVTLNNNSHYMAVYDPCTNSPSPPFYNTCN